MLATYFSSLCELFNLTLLFLHDELTSLAIVSESALLQFMQFVRGQHRASHMSVI